MNDDAVRAFLGELVDDAGLFPPARLAMDEALAAHERTLAGDAYWMVGRFVVAASRLDELSRALDAGPRPLPVTAVIDAALPAPNLLASLARSAAGARERIAVESLEVPLANLSGDGAEDGIAQLHAAAATLDGVPQLYVEIAPGQEHSFELTALHRLRARGVRVCAKVRCGGSTAQAVPSVEALAHFVWTANRLEVPFKATAGLHHPVRRDDRALGAAVHGFLNLFGAAVLTRARGLDPPTVAVMLSDTDPAHFTLDRERFAWRGIGADAAEIGDARAHFAHSFGSCSLDEPVDDLRSLGVLEAAA